MCIVFHMEAGEFEVQIGASAHDVILKLAVETEREDIHEDIIYSLTTLIGDMVRHPVGTAFYESHLDDLADGIAASGILGDVLGDDNLTIPKEQLKKMTKGLYSQSISTLKKFLPKLTENDWVELLNKLNS